jgi:hypothetical protein
MRKLTDGERDILAELEADARSMAGDGEPMTDDEREQIEAEIWAEIDASRYQSH